MTKQTQAQAARAAYFAALRGRRCRLRGRRCRLLGAYYAADINTRDAYNDTLDALYALYAYNAARDAYYAAAEGVKV